MSKGLVLVAIIIIIFGLFYWAKNTPQYATWQIIRSYQTHNEDNARKYIDIDRVAEEFSNDFARIYLESVNNPPANWIESLTKVVYTSVISNSQEQIREETKKVILGSISGEYDDNKSLPDFKSLSFKDVFPGGKVDFTNDQPDVLVHIPNQEQQIIVLRMSKQHEGWKVVKLENIQEFLENSQE